LSIYGPIFRDRCTKVWMKKETFSVVKCEIFDRSDFHDFYTIKPFWVGDFGK